MLRHEPPSETVELPECSVSDWTGSVSVHIWFLLIFFSTSSHTAEASVSDNRISFNHSNTTFSNGSFGFALEKQ